MDNKKVASELLKIAKCLIAEGKVFDINSVEDAMTKLKSGIKAPHVFVSKSTLGGDERVSIYIKLSLDDKANWSNGIYENSRYFTMSFYNEGMLEVFSGGLRSHKFRKTRVKSVEDAITKINKHLSEVKDVDKTNW